MNHVQNGNCSRSDLSQIRSVTNQYFLHLQYQIHIRWLGNFNIRRMSNAVKLCKIRQRSNSNSNFVTSLVGLKRLSSIDRSVLIFCELERSAARSAVSWSACNVPVLGSNRLWKTLAFPSLLLSLQVWIAGYGSYAGYGYYIIILHAGYNVMSSTKSDRGQEKTGDQTCSLNRLIAITWYSKVHVTTAERCRQRLVTFETSLQHCFGQQPQYSSLTAALNQQKVVAISVTSNSDLQT